MPADNDDTAHPLSATKLRAEIYQVLDRVLETGVPALIQRGGRLLRIVPVPEGEAKLVVVQRDVLRGDPDELVHVDWSETWKP